MSLAAQETMQKDTLSEARLVGRATKKPAILLSLHNDFGSVENVWRRFEMTADCFAFQTFEFLETWYRHLGARSNIDVQIVVAWGAGGKPAMILPLGIESSGSLRRLIWLGNYVTDYNAPLLAPDFAQMVAPESFPALWNDICSILPAHDLVELMRQPALVGDQPNPFMELKTQLNASGAHMTVLCEEFDDYYDKKRNAKAKRHFRSRRKKLQEIGETVYVHPETDAEIEASVEKLVEFKSAALNAMGAWNFLEEPGYIDFYKELSVKSGADGFAHVSHLEVGGEYVAGNWGLVHKGRFYYLVASYDGPNFGRFAPGVQALVETMRWATEKGVNSFDFTIGDEAYKSEWCEKQIELFDHLKAATTKGALTLAAARIFLGAKRTIKQSPLLWKMFTTVRSRFLSK